MKYAVTLFLALLLLCPAAARADHAPTQASLPTLQARANKGSVNAQYELGWRYFQGKGAPLDYGTAAKWFRKVAAKGDPFAEMDLGQIYAKGGYGVEQSDEEAAKWFHAALANKKTPPFLHTGAQQGYATARAHLKKDEDEEKADKADKEEKPAAASALSLPHFDVEAHCRAGAFDGNNQVVNKAAYDACIGYEQKAYDELKKGWPGYDPEITGSCNKSVTGTAATYAALQACIAKGNASLKSFDGAHFKY